MNLDQILYNTFYNNFGGPHWIKSQPDEVKDSWNKKLDELNEYLAINDYIGALSIFKQDYDN